MNQPLQSYQAEQVLLLQRRLDRHQRLYHKLLQNLSRQIYVLHRKIVQRTLGLRKGQVIEVTGVPGSGWADVLAKVLQVGCYDYAAAVQQVLGRRVYPRYHVALQRLDTGEKGYIAGTLRQLQRQWSPVPARKKKPACARKK